VIDQFPTPMSEGVLCSASCVMEFFSGVYVVCASAVQRPVRTSKQVKVVHRYSIPVSEDCVKGF